MRRNLLSLNIQEDSKTTSEKRHTTEYVDQAAEATSPTFPLVLLKCESSDLDEQCYSYLEQSRRSFHNATTEQPNLEQNM